MYIEIDDLYFYKKGSEKMYCLQNRIFWENVVVFLFGLKIIREDKEGRWIYYFYCYVFLISVFVNEELQVCFIIYGIINMFGLLNLKGYIIVLCLCD